MNKGTPADPLPVEDALMIAKQAQRIAPDVDRLPLGQNLWVSDLVRALAALATKPAETPTHTQMVKSDLPFPIGHSASADGKTVTLHYPTESAGKAVQRPADAVRDGLERLFGTEAGRVSVEVERAAHGLDFSPQALLSAVKILRHLAETQRSQEKP